MPQNECEDVKLCKCEDWTLPLHISHFHIFTFFRFLLFQALFLDLSKF